MHKWLIECIHKGGSHTIYEIQYITLYHNMFTGPLADPHEIKGFFIKAILGKIKVVSLKF